MPSLRKRVSSYLRQLSFHNEPREKRNNFNENSFVTKYLQGQITLKEGPPILYGKTPTDLPNYDLGSYTTGTESIIGCYTGPNGGLTTVKRTEKHLSVLDTDIDYIDTQDDTAKIDNVQKSPKLVPGQPVDNTTMVIKVAGQEYTVTNRQKKHNKSQSLGSLSDFQIEIGKTKSASNENNNVAYCSNNNHTIIEAEISNNNVASNGTNDNTAITQQNSSIDSLTRESANDEKLVKNVENTSNTSRNCDTKSKETNGESSDCDNNAENKPYGLAKSKSDGNPFRHKKQGKIIRIERPTTSNRDDTVASSSTDGQSSTTDSLLPSEWNRNSDCVFGMSDSLYDRNQVTKVKNGDPIADCFGIIARRDSAVLAVADGVNWGEKACIAAKSAIHGCLHYLNKTLFNDTGPFENLVHHEGLDTASCASSNKLDASLSDIQIGNTREVFVCLLRAFNCAHDLILENKGMLTTLTVAVILPLSKSRANTRHFEQYKETDTDNPSDNDTEKYICCVCNVGDTLAYVYSQKSGVRELTKGSHDINCNRDMRDALGALGPVDGINPELSNLTLSITTIEKGDIVMIASDGLSDNFDPNVCKFSVINPNPEPAKPKRPSTSATSSKDHNKENRRDVRAGSAPLRTENIQHTKSRPKSTEIKTDNITNTGIKHSQEKSKPPIKPPRRSKNMDSLSRSSSERRDSIEKAPVEDKKAPIASPTESLLTINTPLEATKNIVEEKTPKKADTDEVDNPLVAQFLRDNSLDSGNNTFERVKKALISPSTKNSQGNDNTRASQRGLPQMSSQRSKRPAPHTVTVKAPPQKAESLTRKSEPPKQNYKLQYSKSMDVKKPETKPSKPTESPRGYAFLRSKTSVDIRPKSIWRNADGIPYVTPLQRYELTLLLMEDILKKGISGRDNQVVSARKLCENLISFTFSITAAKRHTLEDNDLYFDNRNGVMVEVSAQEKKMRRKRALEKVQNLPGKLDHVSIVAYNVGLFSH